jgi:hypothetical protein
MCSGLGKPAIKMIIGEWYVDELASRTREIMASEQPGCCRFITNDEYVNRDARFRLRQRFFRERDLAVVASEGRGLSAERVATLERQRRAPITPVSCTMSVMPFFEFVLVMIGIGTFAVLLTALVLTTTAGLH